MRGRGFTLTELIATMLVLGVIAGFAAPLIAEMSRSAVTQREQRRELWNVNHTFERVVELLRTAPDTAADGSGLVEVSAARFERADGRGIRFDQGVLYLFDDDGETALAEDVVGFEISVTRRDGETDASDAPEEAWSCSFGVDTGAGMIRTAVSLARPSVEDSGLLNAFAFGQDDWTRPVPAVPSRDYIKIVQDGKNFLYDAARGYGYVDVSGLDTTPNNRGVFSGDDEIYDQFIGAKGGGGNQIVFRVDVPNGDYGFVLAGGDASHSHTSSYVARDGSNAKSDITLVTNAFHNAGEVVTLGFQGRSAPEADGSGTQPVFLDQGSSPTLSVTQGYIEILQVDANDNGGSLCLLEIWNADTDSFSGINFNDYTVEAFTVRDGGGGRDTVHEIQDDGYTMRLYGNAWKAIELPYNITPDTVVEFEYASTSEGDDIGVMTASTLFSVENNRKISVWGSAHSAGIEPPTIDEYPGDGAYRWYTVPLQPTNPAYPLGNTRYLVLYNADTAGPYSESFFRNVRIYEQ